MISVSRHLIVSFLKPFTLQMSLLTLTRLGKEGKREGQEFGYPVEAR